MNEYLSDEEYDDWFFDLGGARDDVIRLLKARGLGRGSRVLDVAAGHGTLTLKVAQAVRDGEVVAVGLPNDLSDYKSYRTQVPEGRFSRMVGYVEMNATRLAFRDSCFDFVINFLGLEDIRMTTGEEGLTCAIGEMARVTRPDGYVQVAIVDYGNEPDEVLLKDVESYIGHGAIFPPPEFLRKRMRESGLEMEEELPGAPGRKLTARQAKEEIRFACERIPVIFQKYGVRTRDFEEVWNKFGADIERVGLAHYSRILSLVARKPLR